MVRRLLTVLAMTITLANLVWAADAHALVGGEHEHALEAQLHQTQGAEHEPGVEHNCCAGHSHVLSVPRPMMPTPMPASNRPAASADPLPQQQRRAPPLPPPITPAV